MKDREFSSYSYEPVVVKAGKKTLVYLDYKLTMKGTTVEGRGWGVANKSDTDEYNAEFGIALAKIRANKDVMNKIEKKLVKYSRKFCERTGYYTPGLGYQPKHRVCSKTATETLIRKDNELYGNTFLETMLEGNRLLNEIIKIHNERKI
jgi:hypothetical protein